MKIYTVGSRYYMAQLPRIEDAFISLGHELVENIEEAELVYSNDEHHFTEVIEAKNHKNIRGKIMFNVLDVPIFLHDYSVDNLKNKLKYADFITAISLYTKKELEKYCGISADIIYNPIKRIEPIQGVTMSLDNCRIRFLSVGRRFDPNKRMGLWAEALQKLKISSHEVGLVGEEGGYGIPLGVLDDTRLNAAYSAVDFVLCTGKVEGICLPMMEACAAGAIPIICNDLSTREEFFPSSKFPEYLTVDPNSDSVAEFIGSLLRDEQKRNLLRERLYIHYLRNWKDKLSGEGVASAILNVYRRYENSLY